MIFFSSGPNFSDFELKILGKKIDLARVLNGQPIQFMAKVVRRGAGQSRCRDKGREGAAEPARAISVQLEVLHEAQCQGPALGDGPNAAGRAVADAASK